MKGALGSRTLAGTCVYPAPDLERLPDLAWHSPGWARLTQRLGTASPRRPPPPWNSAPDSGLMQEGTTAPPSKALTKRHSRLFPLRTNLMTSKKPEPGRCLIFQRPKANTEEKANRNKHSQLFIHVL